MRHRPFAAILLTSLLVSPVASFAAQRIENRGPRLYDRAYRDYHAWDNSEDRLYRRWLAEHHMRPRPLSQLNARQRRNYWAWRHQYQQEFSYRR
jgi:hypothetical protein